MFSFEFLIFREQILFLYWISLISLFQCRLFCRGIVLEPPCPKSVDGISIDPEPNWNFDSLVSEIESVEKKLNAFSKFLRPFTKKTLRCLSTLFSFYVQFVLECSIDLGLVVIYLRTLFVG